ncbi:MAG: amine oxidase [Chitinophagaceae bacterium]|nr:amine oxidase [Chitinophagaceae bacterium]
MRSCCRFGIIEGRKTVRVIEANTRAGGRIFTLDNGMECGAEFVHGKLPITEQLIKESGSSLVPVEGKIYQNNNGNWKEEENFIEGWGELMKCLSGLKHDLSLQEFLQEYFSDEKYTTLRKAVTRFAEGYDLVNMNDASTLALKAEWEKEEDEQYRVKSGYGAIINYLVKQILANKGLIGYGKPVTKIEWNENLTRVFIDEDNFFQSKKILITIPPGIWHKGEKAKGFIHFDPAIPRQIDALKNIGFGAVIKFVLDFSESFWNKETPGAGFIFSNEKIPVWWTCLPTDKNRLTGWFGGLSTLDYDTADEKSLLQLAISSLSGIFKKDEQTIQNLITGYQTVNWNTMPYVYGGYSYTTLHTASARALLRDPVAGSIFFAGEGLYEGPYSGMVEAAFQNGLNVAQSILSK